MSDVCPISVAGVCDRHSTPVGQHSRDGEVDTGLATQPKKTISGVFALIAEKCFLEGVIGKSLALVKCG